MGYSQSLKTDKLLKHFIDYIKILILNLYLLFHSLFYQLFQLNSIDIYVKSVSILLLHYILWEPQLSK